LIAAGRPDGDDQPPAVGQLLDQRLRQMIGSRRHDNRIKGGLLLPTVVAIALPGMHLAIAQRLQAGSGLGRQFWDNLNGVHVHIAQFGQHSRLIAGAGADLQDFIAWLQL